MAIFERSATLRGRGGWTSTARNVPGSLIRRATRAGPSRAACGCAARCRHVCLRQALRAGETGSAAGCGPSRVRPSSLPSAWPAAWLTLPSAGRETRAGTVVRVAGRPGIAACPSLRASTCRRPPRMGLCSPQGSTGRLRVARCRGSGGQLTRPTWVRRRWWLFPSAGGPSPAGRALSRTSTVCPPPSAGPFLRAPGERGLSVPADVAADHTFERRPHVMRGVAPWVLPDCPGLLVCAALAGVPHG